MQHNAHYATLFIARKSPSHARWFQPIRHPCPKPCPCSAAICQEVRFYFFIERIVFYSDIKYSTESAHPEKRVNSEPIHAKAFSDDLCRRVVGVCRRRLRCGQRSAGTLRTDRLVGSRALPIQSVFEPMDADPALVLSIFLVS